LALTLQYVIILTMCLLPDDWYDWSPWQPDDKTRDEVVRYRQCAYTSDVYGCFGNKTERMDTETYLATHDYTFNNKNESKLVNRYVEMLQLRNAFS